MNTTAETNTATPARKSAKNMTPAEMLAAVDAKYALFQAAIGGSVEDILSASSRLDGHASKKDFLETPDAGDADLDSEDLTDDADVTRPRSAADADPKRPAAKAEALHHPTHQNEAPVPGSLDRAATEVQVSTTNNSTPSESVPPPPIHNPQSEIRNLPIPTPTVPAFMTGVRAAAEDHIAYTYNKSPFDDLTPAQQHIIYQLLEAGHSSYSLADLLKLPPPDGLDFTTSPSAIQRFAKRYKSRLLLKSQTACVREARQFLDEAEQHKNPQQALAHATHSLLRLHLYRAAAETEPDTAKLRALSAVLHDLHQESLANRKQAKAEQKKSPPDES